jgi:hypothetical protein
LANPLGTGLGGAVPSASGSNYQSGRRNGWAANELQRASSAQLNPNRRPDTFEAEFDKAGKKDCMKEGSLLVINRLLNGDCPK